jgi:hypothetical protein
MHQSSIRPQDLSFIDTDDAAPTPTCINEPSRQRVESHPSTTLSTPCEEQNERKPFVRLASDTVEDELTILNYSCVISDSPRLRLAVQAAGSLAQLVQVCAYTHRFVSRRFNVVITHRNPVPRHMNFVKLRKRQRLLSPCWLRFLEKAVVTRPSCP